MYTCMYAYRDGDREIYFNKLVYMTSKSEIWREDQKARNSSKLLESEVLSIKA